MRGWKLEAAMGAPAKKGKETFEKGSESNLATNLLSLWAHGTLSAIQIRKLAHAAWLDGAQHQELLDISKCGNYGEAPGNIHRDLMVKFVKHVFVPEPFPLEVTCIDPKSLKKEKVPSSVFLPHLMFSELAKLPNFHEIFPLEKVQHFWSEIEKSGDPRLENHPCKGRSWKKRSIPIWLHGDAAEFAIRDSLMSWSWGPLMSNFSKVETKFMIACFPKSSTAPETWTEIMEVVCWSLNALAKGMHPSHDAHGKPLQKGSPFFEQRGQPLCSGYQCIVWNIQGDMEFFSNHLGLPHWGSLRPCMHCDCKSSPEDESKYFKTIEMDKQNFKHTSNSEVAKHPPSKHPLFHKVPGLTSKMVRGDALHILWVHGLYSHLLGSVLHYLVYREGGGRRQAKPPQERLAILWGEIQQKYTQLGSPTRVTNLKLSMFVDPKAPHGSHPQLSLKGSEARHFLPAFLGVCQLLLEKSIWHEGCMLDCMQSMQSLVELFDQADIVPTAAEHARAMTFAKGFLDVYSFLNQWALEEGKQLFHIVHKFHSFQHLIEDSKHLNWRACWCFANEDWVGQMSKLVFSISPGVRTSKLSFKVGPKYRILLHFLLTRENFSMVED